MTAVKHWENMCCGFPTTPGWWRREIPRLHPRNELGWTEPHPRGDRWTTSEPGWVPPLHPGVVHPKLLLEMLKLLRASNFPRDREPRGLLGASRGGSRYGKLRCSSLPSFWLKIRRGRELSTLFAGNIPPPASDLLSLSACGEQPHPDAVCGGIFWMWDALGDRMLWMWDVLDVGCSGCGML